MIVRIFIIIDRTFRLPFYEKMKCGLKEENPTKIPFKVKKINQTLKIEETQIRSREEYRIFHILSNDTNPTVRVVMNY